MNISDTKTVFLHGIAGSGMRGLAWLLSQKGIRVLGSDGAVPDDLPKQFEVVGEAQAQPLLDQAQMYIHSDAIPADHPLRIHATKRSLPTVSFAQALGQLTEGYRTIAIAGTHGKSSTTAFLAHILISAGLDPSVLIGAAVTDWPGGYARMGESDIFVVEADEYRNHFHHLRPTHLIITTLEYDHPDFFRDISDVAKSFQSVIDALPSNGSCITTREIKQKGIVSLPASATIVEEGTDVAPLPGDHMQMNAALAIAAAEILGVSEIDARQALKTFPGLSRRFENLGNIQSTQIISDYAHHPTEIVATLAAAREKFSDKSVAILFEAHTSERLQAFQEEFIVALQQADAVIFFPPFLAIGRSHTNAPEAYQAVIAGVKNAGTPVYVIDSPEGLNSAILELNGQYDIILACTAGSLDGALRAIVKNS